MGSWMKVELWAQDLFNFCKPLYCSFFCITINYENSTCNIIICNIEIQQEESHGNKKKFKIC
jgi:hypothetical protein